MEHHPNSQRAHMILAETYESLYINEKDESLKISFFDESLKHLKLANKINSSSLSPKTGKLLLHARQNLKLDNNELSDLYLSLKNGIIDASTVNSLQQLTTCLINASCHLDYNTYLLVFSNALSNKNIRRLFKSHLLVHYAQYLAVMRNNYIDAEIFCREAISVYPNKIFHYNYLYPFFKLHKINLMKLSKLFISIKRAMKKRRNQGILKNGKIFLIIFNNSLLNIQ